MKRTKTVCIITALCFAHAAIIPLLAAPPKAPAPNIRLGKSPKHEMEYAWYVPKRYMQGRKIPLVMSFHGAMGKGAGEIEQWVPLADEFGFIVVCPTSELAGAHVKPATPVQVNPDDFQKESEAWLSVLEDLKKQYTIDPRLVMVTGFSGGGNPAYWLAFSCPEQFPFLCARSGNFPSMLRRLYEQDQQLKEKVQTAARTSYIYAYHGDKDHPIILKEAPDTIAWIKSLNPAHFESEEVAGMKHESRARMAAAWFSKKWALPAAKPR